MITINKNNSVMSINGCWDDLISDCYQSQAFLAYLEKYNYCNQRYYCLYNNNQLKAAAMVYTLPVDLFSFFSGPALKFNMTVIGIPLSVDSSGIIGDEIYFIPLVEHILSVEKGLCLSLNYENYINTPKILQLNTLPAIIFNHSKFDSIEDYLSKLRHPYRRRIVRAMDKFNGVESMKTSCKSYSDSHHKLYLNIMSKTKTKLEVLSKDFFSNLPDEFLLTSYYANGHLIGWLITSRQNGTFSFLFGGMDYQHRDIYDTYINILMGVLREGIEAGYDKINFGQTAEVPKLRIGCKAYEKKMFLYHKNILVRKILKLISKQITYKYKFENCNVFK